MTPEAALGHLEPALVHDARVLHCLRRTSISSTWLVALGDRRAVLRLDTPMAGALGLNRDREWRALQNAAAAGLTPAPLARDEARGLLLRVFVPGEACSSGVLRGPARLSELGALLRRVHALPLAGPPLDCEAAIARYAALAGHGAEVPAQTARTALATALAHGTQPCQCHNDPVAGNLLAGSADGALQLIDWEYAAPHDPWFDLAVVAAHHELGPGETGRLLTGYLGQPPEGWQLGCLADWTRFYRALATLWARAVAAAVAAGNGDRSQSRAG